MTDQIADYLFTPSQDGDQNLLREGVAAGKIHFVGNVMIDTLVRLLPMAGGLWPRLSSDFRLAEGGYCLVTLHRPSNVDDSAMLARIMDTLTEISAELPIVFPIHPRTRERLAANKIKIGENGNLQLTDPIGYLDFLCLQERARLVITDSGGIQEETTYLNVPCLTVRENTERPVTVKLGTNTLVGQDMARLWEETRHVLAGQARRGEIPPLWDGKAGRRIAEIIKTTFL